jgi:Cu(I)/Ag(I) efflux system membrane fusion protein
MMSPASSTGSPEGGAVMTGHQHGSSIQTDEVPDHQEAVQKEILVSAPAKGQLSDLLDSYLGLKDALVNDDFKSAKANAQKFQESLSGISMSLFDGDAHQVWMEEGMPLGDLIKQIAEADDIESARKPFKPFSEHVIVLAQVFQPMEKPLFIQHCPMADDFKGADWLSTEENIMNPYYGASMLTCGEVTGQISNQ